MLLYVDPFGGMAGDMLLAALLDLGDERFQLADVRALGDALVPGEWSAESNEVLRGGLRGLHLAVETAETAHAPHRHLSDLLALLERAPLAAVSRERAALVLRTLAEAEARVHRTSVEEVHFHEVGAVDTLIDVCGAVLALERLGVTRVVTAPPLTGEGTVRCAHGVMPVPVPAVSELMRGRALKLGGGNGERLTPTAAALLAALSEDRAPNSALPLVPDATGWGAGTRDPREGPPNLVRVFLGREVTGDPTADESVRPALQVEVNLDDQSPEEIGYVCGLLRSAGALEVWTQPAHMKKDRPGALLVYLCRPHQREELERLVLAHTTTFGVRWWPVRRTEREGEMFTVTLSEHWPVRIKARVRPGRTATDDDLFVEHDDLVAISRESGQALAALRRAALELARAVVAQRSGAASKRS